MADLTERLARQYPRALAAEVVAKTEEIVATESEMRRALVGCMDPVEAYHRYGKF